LRARRAQVNRARAIVRAAGHRPTAIAVVPTLQEGVGEVAMLYMVVEHFRGGDPLPVYRRFRDHGRLAPDGLRYVASWVGDDLGRCFQVMECDDRALLDQWMARWSDLVDFEVVPVMTSEEAVRVVSPRL
jgi:Domain of unknown function (DUF3303)